MKGLFKMTVPTPGHHRHGEEVPLSGALTTGRLDFVPEADGSLILILLNVNIVFKLIRYHVHS